MSIQEILQMVKDGVISAQEGEKLINASQETETKITTNKGKMIKILVDVNEDVKPAKVKVNIPVALFKVALKAGKGFNVNGIQLDEAIDVDMILQAIEHDAMGEIVNVESDEANVRIFID